MRAYVIAVIMLLNACTTIGDRALADRPDDWPPMSLTKAELIRELGPPSIRVTAVGDGKTTELLTWSYTHAEANPALFIPIVGLFVAGSGEGMRGEGRSLAASFDHEGHIVNRTWSKHRLGHQAPITPYVQDF